jgi:hypothetical protein
MIREAQIKLPRLRVARSPWALNTPPPLSFWPPNGPIYMVLRADIWHRGGKRLLATMYAPAEHKDTFDEVRDALVDNGTFEVRMLKPESPAEKPAPLLKPKIAKPALVTRAEIEARIKRDSEVLRLFERAEKLDRMLGRLSGGDVKFEIEVDQYTIEISKERAADLIRTELNNALAELRDAGCVLDVDEVISVQ